MLSCCFFNLNLLDWENWAKFQPLGMFVLPLIWQTTHCLGHITGLISMISGTEDDSCDSPDMLNSPYKWDILLIHNHNWFQSFPLVILVCLRWLFVAKLLINQIVLGLKRQKHAFYFYITMNKSKFCSICGLVLATGIEITSTFHACLDFLKLFCNPCTAFSSSFSNPGGSLHIPSHPGR